MQILEQKEYSNTARNKNWFPHLILELFSLYGEKYSLAWTEEIMRRRAIIEKIFSEKYDKNFDAIIVSLFAKIKDKTISILSFQKAENESELIFLLSELERLKECYCKRYVENPAKLFQTFIDFSSWELAELTKGGFYNNAPNMSFQEYSEKNLQEMFMNNLIRPDSWFKQKYDGGSCIHRTIFLKKMLESRNIAWAESMIIKYKGGNHAFLIINFEGNCYKMEKWGGGGNGILQKLSEEDALFIDKNVDLKRNIAAIEKHRGVNKEIKIGCLDKKRDRLELKIDRDSLEFIQNGIVWSSFTLPNIDVDELSDLNTAEILYFLVDKGTMSIASEEAALPNIKKLITFFSSHLNKKDIIALLSQD